MHSVGSTMRQTQKCQLFGAFSSIVAPQSEIHGGTTPWIGWPHTANYKKQ